MRIIFTSGGRWRRTQGMRRRWQLHRTIGQPRDQSEGERGPWLMRADGSRNGLVQDQVDRSCVETAAPCIGGQMVWEGQ